MSLSAFHLQYKNIERQFPEPDLRILFVSVHIGCLSKSCLFFISGIVDSKSVYSPLCGD